MEDLRQLEDGAVMLWNDHPHSGAFSVMYGFVLWTADGEKSVHLKGA